MALRTLVLLLAVVGCGSSAGPPDLSCKADADCVVSCMVPDDCCGDLCDCSHVYNTKWLDSARKDHERTCEQNKCTKVADCAMPTTRSIARCKAGRCAIEEVPR